MCNTDRKRKDQKRDVSGEVKKPAKIIYTFREKERAREKERERKRERERESEREGKRKKERKRKRERARDTASDLVAYGRVSAEAEEGLCNVAVACCRCHVQRRAARLCRRDQVRRVCVWDRK
jgi:hypothetical protein